MKLIKLLKLNIYKLIYMNTIIRNNKEYKLIGFWDDKNSYDSKGKKFIVPKHNQDIWLQQQFFIDKLTVIQLLLKQQDAFKLNDNKKDCYICNDKNITTGQYYYKKFIWEDGLQHYIEKHNYIPDETFQDIVFFFKLESKVVLKSKIKDKDFIKINKN